MLPFQQSILKNNEVKTFEDIEVYVNQCITSVESDTLRQTQLEQAATNFDFYTGAQWTEEENDAYVKNGVTPLTINRCRPQIKSLLGLYASNKQEIKVIPRKGGTEIAANVYTELLRHTHDQSNGDFVFFETLRKGSIETECWLHFNKNRTKNAGGQLEYHVVSIGDAFPDPGCIEYDINLPGREGRFFVHRVYKNIEELEILYPDYVDQFNISKNLTQEYVSRLADNLLGRNAFDDGERFNRLPVRYVWWRQSVKAGAFADLKSRTVTKLTDPKKMKQAARRAKKNPNRFEYISYVDYVLHVSTVVCETLVDDTESPLGEGFNKLPFARFSPFYDNGVAEGILNDIISLNREENINRTQATRYLNQTVNSGWKVGDGSNREAVQNLLRYGSINGIVIDEKKLGGKVEKILPNPISQGHIFTAERSSQDIKEVTGLNDDVMGYSKGAGDSGRAISLRQNQGIQSNEPIFQNFYYTLQLFGQMVFDAMRTAKVYTDIEIREIVKKSSLLTKEHLAESERILTDKIGGGLPAPMALTPPPVETFAQIPLNQKQQVYTSISNGIKASQIYAAKYPILRETFDEVNEEHAIQRLLEELNSETLGEYGVKVITSPSAQSVRMQNFLELDAIQEKYGIIPPDVFVEATDLANKEEIIGRMREQQQAASVQQAQQKPTPQGAVA